MKNCASGRDTSSIGFKRFLLLIACGTAYQDVILDCANAYQLYCDDKISYAACIVALLFVPNILTWLFLRANGMTSVKDLFLLIFQLGPLSELINSWSTGTPSHQMMWFLAAEGLGEAPLTGIVTTYIVAFGGQQSWTFYAGILSSFLSIAKTATTINFYGEKPAWSEWIMEYVCRFPECASRVLFMGCLAYLMKQPESGDDERQQTTQTAIFAYMLISLTLNVGMIAISEPRSSWSVSVFFGGLMVASSPLRFLEVFKRMAKPFKLIRFIETFAMAVLCVCPLDPNPRFYDLLEQAPILVHALVGSFAFFLLAESVAALYALLGNRSRGDGDYAALQSLQERAVLVKQRLRVAADAGDFLMTGMIANLEGSDLNDAVFVLIVYATFPELAQNSLREQGMSMDPKATKETGFCHELREFFGSDLQLQCAWFKPAVFSKFGISTASLKEAGFKASDFKRIDLGWTSSELKRGGYSAAECKTGGFALAECKDAGFDARALKDAGFSAGQLMQTGFSAGELKQGGFFAGELKHVGVGAEELLQAGFILGELKQGGFTLGELEQLGFNARDMEVKLGDRVIIHGLKLRADLNNQTATLVGPAANGRVNVKLDSGESIALKQENLCEVGRDIIF
jgi:hypothetical protein